MAADLSSGAGFAAQSDPWLGGVIGRPALRLVKTGQSSRDWIKRLEAEPLFVTAKVPARDLAATSALEGLGFRMVDAALTFEVGRMADARAAPHIRFAAAQDRAAVARIAGTSFVYSRFHLDPVFPSTLGNKIKALWAENYFDGKRGDGMVVAEHDGAVAGFMLLLRAANMLVIDLIAVAPNAARKGLARAMIEFASVHGAGSGKSERPAGIRAGTQAANVPSVRLYESLGFRFTEANFVLHHHGHGGSYGAAS